MLHDTPCKCKESLNVDGVRVSFSLAREGAKVRRILFMHRLVS